MKPHDCYPLVIHLPDGTCATALPGLRPPRYFVDGEELAINVTIPADLVATGWCWQGSFLRQPHPEGSADGPGIALFTFNAPPPGWNYTVSGRIRVPGFWPSCFVRARRFDVSWRQYLAEKAAQAAMPKKVKKVKKIVKPKPVLTPAPVVERVAQLVMEW